MANRTVFAGWYNAVDYFYGGGVGFPPPLTCLTGPNSSPITNPGTCTLQSGVAVKTDGGVFYPLNTNAPVLIGNGPGQESVTPSAVGNPTSDQPGQASLSGTFTKLHGQGDSVASATFGLQEALNDAARAPGGGKVVVDKAWVAAGGTNAIYAAVTVPAGVTKVDNR